MATCSRDPRLAASTAVRLQDLLETWIGEVEIHADMVKVQDAKEPTSQHLKAAVHGLRHRARSGGSVSSMPSWSNFTDTRRYRWPQKIGVRALGARRFRRRSRRVTDWWTTEPQRPGLETEASGVCSMS